MTSKVSLKQFNNNDFNPGKSKIVIILWYITNALFFINPLFPFNRLKIILLRLFGANIGSNNLFKPRVNIKYPWNLKTGDNVWIGEMVWIDNLDKVIISDNVCISQGAMLLTGNHDYNKKSFNLITKTIIIHEGVWIAAKAIVCPGVICGEHSVLSVNCVATSNLEPYTIYKGNPISAIKVRKIN